jgi:hypothetical protein
MYTYFRVHRHPGKEIVVRMHLRFDPALLPPGQAAAIWDGVTAVVAAATPEPAAREEYLQRLEKGRRLILKLGGAAA